MFAWNVDAQVYFYQTNVVPWEVVYSDGLDLSLAKQDNEKISVVCEKWETKENLGWSGKKGSALLDILDLWVDYHFRP